jgi:flagellar biosynthetic protein FliR
MRIDLDPGWMLAVFYTVLRLGAVLLLSPILAGLGGLATVRVLLTLALSAVLAPGLVVQPDVVMAIGPVISGACNELLTGVTLAFGVFAAFGAFSVAGKILDVQSGFGIGSVYDPVTRAGAPLFATMLNMLGVVMFFALDGHHALLRGLAFSLQQVPPGTGLENASVAAVIGQFGVMFSLGVALVIPVVVCLLLAETGIAVVSRVLPQMNVFVVSVPVKIIATISLLALTAGGLAPTMGRIYASIFIYWQRVMA